MQNNNNSYIIILPEDLLLDAIMNPHGHEIQVNVVTSILSLISKNEPKFDELLKFNELNFMLVKTPGMKI